MAIHILRDYQQQYTTAARSVAAYVTAVFLRRVLGFSFVGHTNFGINTAPAATTIAAASNGQTLPQATINVASTAAFPTAGNIVVRTTTGIHYVMYTGKTATSFTGCVAASGSGGTMSTGNSVTTVLLATGDTSPEGAPTFPPGSRAGINFGAGFEKEVSIPAASWTVAAGDVGRILVLQSTANPRFNSGVFLITGVNVGANRFIVNWRSGDNPPAEAADSMNWYLYEADSMSPPCIQAGSANSGAGYRSNGTSTACRIILQSPHSTGWQVRICMESDVDFTTNTSVPMVTMTVGFDGTAAGDFLVGGRHNHVTLFYDAGSSTGSRHRASGIRDTISVQHRFTIVGEDTGQAFALFGRHTTATSSWQLVAGLPDEEALPLPSDPVNRIFSLGLQYGGSNSITFGYQPTDTTNVNTHGSTMGFSGVPVSCTTGCWTYASGPAQNGSQFFDVSAGDSPWISATELVTVELVAGALHTFNTAAAVRYLPLEPRVMGVVPMLRQGRTNFGNFTLTTDVSLPSKGSWQHMMNGVYIPWGGPAVLA